MHGYNTELLLQIGICIVVFVAVVVAGWSRRYPTVGLPVCYLLTLVMIHWVGAFIHALPWYTQLETPEVILGFKQCFYGVVFFGAGYLLLSPSLATAFGAGVAGKVVDTRLPEIYLVLGLVFFGVLAPALIMIPSIGSAAVCGAYLFVVGICLGCWRAWQSGAPHRVFLWLPIAAALPVITTVALGFLGYGTVAALIVLAFVFSFYKPRWQSALALLLAFYLGLSLFVTYMRDRTLIRESVWGGSSHFERLDTFKTTFSEFELIDFTNEEHLELIDLRLNQNFLVGAAVTSLQSGARDYAKGGTIWDSLLALVPRILWPAKSVRAGSGNMVTNYTGIEFAEGTSVGVGQVLEFYLNFGTAGVIVGFLVMGIIVGIVDTKAAIHLRNRQWPQFAQWLVPGISLLQTGGSLVELTGSAAASTVLILFINKVVLLWLRPSAAHTGTLGTSAGAKALRPPLKQGRP